MFLVEKKKERPSYLTGISNIIFFKKIPSFSRFRTKDGQTSCCKRLALCMKSCTMPNTAQHIRERTGSESGLICTDTKLKKTQAGVESLRTGTGAPGRKWGWIKTASRTLSHVQWAQQCGLGLCELELRWLGLLTQEHKRFFTAIGWCFFSNKYRHSAWNI